MLGKDWCGDSCAGRGIELALLDEKGSQVQSNSQSEELIVCVKA